jgi:hypothetical protein
VDYAVATFRLTLKETFLDRAGEGERRRVVVGEQCARIGIYADICREAHREWDGHRHLSLAGWLAVYEQRDRAGGSLPLERLRLASRRERDARRVASGRDTVVGDDLECWSATLLQVYRGFRSWTKNVNPPSTSPCDTSTPSAPPSRISTRAVTLYGRLRILGPSFWGPLGRADSRRSASVDLDLRA